VAGEGGGPTSGSDGEAEEEDDPFRLAAALAWLEGVVGGLAEELRGEAAELGAVLCAALDGARAQLAVAGASAACAARAAWVSARKVGRGHGRTVALLCVAAL
jgi:hypothetical protein